MKTLLMPAQVDRILRYPRGRSARLARQGRLPHILLPDGEIRFDQAEIDKLLTPTGSKVKEASHAR